MIKKVATYIIIIGAFVSLIGVILEAGNKLIRTDKIELSRKTDISTFTDKAKPVVINSNESVFRQLSNNIKYPISILMLQAIIILFASKLFGIIMKMFGQQTVVGEIIAGIFLGPSILGWLFPDLSALIFPHESLISLQFLSQIGLAFFMFVIGMELDLSKIKNKTQDAVIISHASIIFPFFLGACLSYFIFLDLAPQNVSFVSFTLFLGIAMSITAFPVLARILKERGLTRTPLGVLTITCAAADDVTAWCLLAAVIAIVKAGSIASALFTIGLTVIYLVFMFIVLKPWLQKSSEKHMVGESIDKTTIAISFFVLLLSAYFTEIIGIHALFGAFIAGVIMPDNVRFKAILIDKIEDVSTILLLPIFFAFTGLRTQIGSINTGYLWLLCGLIMLVAIIGKFGGSALTARIVGRSWQDSLSIGALMNTRGLMELVVLNIGYDLGVLGPEIFSIMVLMALCTTFLTGPLLDLINYSFKKK
ncbi:MAG: cation:proton antiporter [Prolixibacteraceae bacterium]|jgi:Kef-type K+ transport system membrane component KefB|nr:cation:proton antiporter [Prolixibacteraceae bacterium]